MNAKMFSRALIGSGCMLPPGTSLESSQQFWLNKAAKLPQFQVVYDCILCNTPYVAIQDFLGASD